MVSADGAGRADVSRYRADRQNRTGCPSRRARSRAPVLAAAACLGSERAGCRE